MLMTVDESLQSVLSLSSIPYNYVLSSAAAAAAIDEDEDKNAAIHNRPRHQFVLGSP